MLDRPLAALVLVTCLVLLVRLMVGERRRHRMDAAARALWQSVRRGAMSLRHRRASKKAAEEAIERARHGGEWDGNVYRPKAFRKPPRDKMH